MRSLLKSSSTVVKQQQLPSLMSCIMMDVIGCASYAIPFFGEVFDLIWAPISAMIYWKMFGVKKGFFGGLFSFAEELMPGLDIIPTFTITWLIQYFKRDTTAISFTPLIK
jgi:hypothetical protein